LLPTDITELWKGCDLGDVADRAHSANMPTFIVRAAVSTYIAAGNPHLCELCSFGIRPFCQPIEMARDYGLNAVELRRKPEAPRLADTAALTMCAHRQTGRPVGLSRALHDITDVSDRTGVLGELPLANHGSFRCCTVRYELRS
jgi:hypothetical protein